MSHRKADILLPETNASLDYLEKLGCNCKSVTVAPHGINVSEFKLIKPDYDFAGTLKLDRKSLETRLKVLYAGGYYTHKGIDVFIAMIEKKLISDNIMIFIPEFGDNIEKYHKKLSGRDNISLLPLLGYNDLKKLYSLMDIVIVPSITEKGTERSPNVIIEALAMGKTVIASNIGGIPTILGNAGVLVEQNNPDELAAALNKFSVNRDQLRKYRKKARGHAEKILNADVYSETMINEYYSFMGKADDRERCEP